MYEYPSPLAQVAFREILTPSWCTHICTIVVVEEAKLVILCAQLSHSWLLGVAHSQKKGYKERAFSKNRERERKREREKERERERERGWEKR